MSQRYTNPTYFSQATSVSFVSSQPHTFCGWIYPINNAGNGCILYGDINGSSSFNMTLGMGAGSLFLQENNFAYSFSGPNTLNAWSHLALTYDGTNLRSYINGVLSNTGAFSAAGRADWQVFAIGNLGGGSTIDTTVQDVMVYTSALTGAQVQAVMTTQQPPAGVSTWAWWPLAASNPTLDQSGNGHTLNRAGNTDVAQVLLAASGVTRTYGSAVATGGTPVVPTGRLGKESPIYDRRSPWTRRDSRS